MAEAQILLYAIQAIQFALKLVGAGSQAHTVLSQTNETLLAMQADGNRAPSADETAAQNALLDQLVEQPPQA